MAVSLALVDQVADRNPDYRLDELVLRPVDSGAAEIDIATAILDGQLELTIEGASTVPITVDDSDRIILRSALLVEWAWGTNADNRDEATWIKKGRTIDVQLDDLWFRLVRAEKQGTTLLITLEDREVHKLRQQRGKLKAFRDRVTRAQFIKRLCDLAGVPCYIPELNVRQAIEAASQKLTKTQRKKRGEKGLDRSADLTVKGVAAKPDQLRIVERDLDVADSLSAPARAMEALVAALIDENKVSNSGPGGSLQVTPDTAARLHIDPHDIEKCAHRFLTAGYTTRSVAEGGAIGLARKHPDMKVAEIAAACQGNRDGASSYQPFVAEAQKFVRAYKPGISSSGETEITVTKRYAFARGRKETSWDCIQRLAEEVGWRAFMRKGVLWYASEEWLFAQAPALTRVSEPVIGHDGEKTKTYGVDNIDFAIDSGARNLVAELSIDAHVDRWTALPGMVVSVTGMGPADGRWLVHSITRPLWDDLAQVTCNKPIPSKAEPAPETSTETVDSGTVGKVQKLYDVADAISDAKGPYVWGGGHVPDLSKVKAKHGLDCSGSLSLAFYRAGFIPKTGARVASAFKSFGEPGKGKWVTVWASDSHCFVEFHVPDRPGKRFDTSQHGGGSGPRVLTQMRSTAGFTPRHIKGL